MSHSDLAEWAQRRPFVPFRLYLTDGSTFEVRHPELCMIGRHTLVVGIALDPETRVYDRTAYLDLLHVMRVEPLSATVEHS